MIDTGIPEQSEHDAIGLPHPTELSLPGHISVEDAPDINKNIDADPLFAKSPQRLSANDLIRNKFIILMTIN